MKKIILQSILLNAIKAFLCIMIRFLLKHTFFSTLLLVCFDLLGQPILIDNPYITNHTKTNYNGGIENWDAVATKDGDVYVANNEGLLNYNGTKWVLHKLPNKTIVRSVALDTLNNRIYVGGQDEVGYFYPSKNGSLDYKSLKTLLPKDYTSIEDVWEIQIAGPKVLFRSVNKIFAYANEKITTIDVPGKSINFLKYINGKIYAGDPIYGVYEVAGGPPKLLAGSEVFKGHRISDIIELSKDKLLFVTEKNGVFTYQNGVFRPFLTTSHLKNAILSSAVVINENLIAVGSVLKGIIFLDADGHHVFSITKDQGLQTNSIITLTLDINGNIWAGTTNGIDHVLINSPYSIIYADAGLQGGVYAVKIFDDKLFVGTNNGLFYTAWNEHGNPFKTKPFSKVVNSDGQVWALDVVGDALFMGHNEGAFQILGDKAIKISNDYEGSWSFIALPDANKMLVGTYSGFKLYKKEGNTWRQGNDVKGFKESARIVAKDKYGDIWVSHPYRGVYRLTLTNSYDAIDELKNYGVAHGLPSNMANYVTRLKDDIYVNAETGIYLYDKKNDKFVMESELSAQMGTNANTRRMFQKDNNSIWYVNEKECGMLTVDEKPLTKKVAKQITPFLHGKLIGGFENIYAHDDNHVFACTDKGLILVNPEKLKNKQTLKIRFTKIVSGDSIIYGGYGAIPEEKMTFPSDQNYFIFSFGSNQMDLTKPVLYSYHIENLDDKWSEWTPESHKELNNLRPGKYTFQLKAKTDDNNEASEISFTFNVGYPWYRTGWAIAFYFILFVVAIFALVQYVDRKHETEKTQLKQEKEESEAKVEVLINEKLQSEIDFKNKELALSTMHIVQKNETLAKLREELDTIVKQTKDSDTKSNIKKVIGILSDDHRLEDDWESFAVHFDQVHTDFIRRIKEKYPQLSPKDLKLCAYLRMNLTTKEIAPLLNISVRGVEISRYRLRKKMEIDQDLNLNDFMMHF
ncbi:MAG TPA: triple tyrosine motif-containing protein [Saprospiraceae bacterium]|nr:triple tyrosine motif-containing protein [Saprospiraceae bacterium]